MKTKLKQKRGEPIALEGGIKITSIMKYEAGWKVNADCITEVSREPCIQTSNEVVLSLSRSDFDRLQHGDTIRFLAVVTRPRKSKIKNPDFSKDSPSAIAAEVAG